jgi:hypothetical protein
MHVDNTKGEGKTKMRTLKWLLMIGLNFSVAQADPITWVRKFPSASPSARAAHAMAFDSTRNRVVLFGGRAGSPSYFSDTWEYDGLNWTTAASGPPAMAYHAMTFDSTRGRTVLFGGQATGGVVLGATWEYDGSSWAQVATSGPSTRFGHALAYDANRQKTVLYGGTHLPDGQQMDTWEWNGASWTQSSGVYNWERAGHVMGYDPVRHVIVAHGGYGNTGTYDYDGNPIFGIMNDSCEYDGANWTPTASGPGRQQHAGAFDVLRSVMVLFGGSSDTAPFTAGDTYSYGGAAWSEDSSTGPAARWNPVMVYDSTRGKMVLFGGVNESSFQNDTWEY